MVHVAWIAGVVAACQSYAPRPLDDRAHRAAWHGRIPERESLASFLERVELEISQRDFDLRDGVDLEEGRLVALAFHPRLRLARLQLERSAAGAEHAGLLADPQFSLTVLRATESIPDPWVISPAITMSLPLSERLAAERDLAQADAATERASLLEIEWSVWSDVERAWVGWSAARMRSRSALRSIETLETLERLMTELGVRGEVQPTEANLFRIERVRMHNRLLAFDGEAAALEQALRAQLGLAPQAPIDFVPQFGGETKRSVAATELAEQNPTLARLKREYASAEEKLRREIAKQMPDLVIGPQYESEEGTSRLGLLGAIPLPLFNANRRAIAEARVAREIARAAWETGYEVLAGRLVAGTARLAAISSQREELEQSLLPLVDRQQADALELLRLGEASPLLVLESVLRAQQVDLDLIDVLASESLARIDVEQVIGPRSTQKAVATEDDVE